MFMIQSIILATAGAAKCVDNAVKNFDGKNREEELKRFRSLSREERHNETMRSFYRRAKR